MKCKLYYLLGMIGTFCFNQQKGFAIVAQQQQDAVIDSVGQIPKKTIQVQDRLSSKLLDSVRVKLGRESKYTHNGVVVFENNPDSILILEKPEYYRTGIRTSDFNVKVRLVKRSTIGDSFAINAKPESPQAKEFYTIKGDDLRQVSISSVMEGLQVYVPSLFVDRAQTMGSNPNVLPSTYLRGMNSFPFSASGANKNVPMGVQVNPSSGDFRAYQVVQPNSPVFLLDGVQVTAQTIQDIDINRIKSVSILDGAAETAGYGLRGGNGVIAVYTDKPKGKFQISFTEQVQLVTPDISSLQMLNAKQKLEVEKNSGLFDNPALDPIYQKRYEQAYANQINTNWLEVPIQNQVGTKHSLTMTAGNEDIVYGLNAGYNDIQGVMKGSGRKILDLGAYFGGRIGALTFNNQFTYLGVNATNSAYGSYDQYQKMNPYWRAIDPATGKYQKIIESDTIGGQIITFKNPAYNTTLATTDKGSYSRYSNLTNLNWVIGSGFQVSGMVNIAHQADDRDYFLPPSHTVFADISAENFFKRGLYEKGSNSFFDVQAGGQLNYQNEIGKHRVFVNIGQYINQTSSSSEGIAVRGFAVDRLADISFGNAYSIPKPISGKIVSRYASSFVNATYDFDRRYQINLTGAYDNYSAINSAVFSKGIGATWNLHQESFLADVTWLSLLKVKGSLGTSGNQNYLSYLNRNTYNYYTDQQYIPSGSNMGTIGMGLGAYLTGIGNAQLKSPTVSKQDLSLDAAFFQNRLALNVLYYRQLSKDMVLPVLSASTSGFQDFAYYTNYGKMESSGVQFAAMAKIIDRPNSPFKLDVLVNAFHGKDKIKESGPFIEQLNAVNNGQTDQTFVQPQYVNGYAASALWVVPSLGIDAQTGNEIFRKKDGSSTQVWDANDKVFAGNLTPDWNGAFGVNMSYKQFSLASYFQYALGAHVYNSLQAGLENASVHENLSVEALSDKRWTPGRTDASYKALFHSPTYATSRFVEKQNTLNCSSISVGYQFAQPLLEKISVKRLGIRLMLNNAFDVNSTSSSVYAWQYPMQRSYSFILNATF